MNEEQKQRMTHELGQWNAAMKSSCSVSDLLAISTRMAALLQDLTEQPTSVPVLTVECEPDYWSGGHYYEGTKPYIAPTAVWKLPIGTELYTSPPVNNQSEQHLEMVNPPALSVPDSKTLQFLTDVLTAAGLLRHGKKDAGLATRIADESCRIRQQLFSRPPEQPADLARDAERYRWLRNWTRGAYGIDSNPAFILPHVPTMLDQNIMSGSVAQHLDNAIDAAIERDKLKGGAE